MSKQRTRYSAQFKFQLALEAAKGLNTINELASEHGVHPTQVGEWKRRLLEGGSTIFSRDGARHTSTQNRRWHCTSKLVGSKWNWSGGKKKLPASVEAKRTMIDLGALSSSIRRQCELVGLNRSTFYDAPATASALNLQLMRLIDEPYTKTPFYGWPRMTAYLRRLGLPVNHTRVQRLMRVMGLQASYPKPHTSTAAKAPMIYPYLLGAVARRRPNQVWSADITYVRLATGFMDLVAIIDWWSRYVLAWQLSNTLEVAFCLEALEMALVQGCPEIFTDQGVQFTSLAFTGRLERAGIAISMDGRGRALDNIFVERLWRTVKYEAMYLKDYASVPALAVGLDRYFTFDNHERPHQSLGDQTPAEVHWKQ